MLIFCPVFDGFDFMKKTLPNIGKRLLKMFFRPFFETWIH